jgi:hypothetical protein
VIEGVGLTELWFGEPLDTYGGAAGEANARTFGVHGYAFTATKPAGRVADADPRARVPKRA